MRFLIIGGTGTISFGIAKEALDCGHDVTVINRGSRPYRELKGIKYIKADINDTDSCLEKLNGKHYDIVVDPLGFDKGSLARNISIFGQYCKKYVFISSCCAFGCSDSDDAIDENYKMNPESKYGKKKKECEEFLISQSFGFNYTIIRPYITYGDIRIPIPYACRINPYTVIERIRNNKPLVCFDFLGENNSLHNLMEVKDFSRIVVSIICSSDSNNNDYNVCGKRTYSWDEAYTTLYECLKEQKHVYFINKKCFKKLGNHLYEDIAFDKDHKGTIYSGTKAVELAEKNGIIVDEITLRDGIQGVVDYLDVNMNNLPIEKQFNIKSDMLLMFAVKNKDDFLLQYLKSFKIKYKIFLTVLWIALSLKNYMAEIKDGIFLNCTHFFF